MRFANTLLLTAIPLLAAMPREPITPENVSQLKVAWTYDTSESPHIFWAKKESHFETTPVYADGNLYISTPAGLVIALDAETGREIWKHDPSCFPGWQLQRTDHAWCDAYRESRLRGHHECTPGLSGSSHGRTVFRIR